MRPHVPGNTVHSASKVGELLGDAVEDPTWKFICLAITGMRRGLVFTQESRHRRRIFGRPLRVAAAG
jgi:hypothetical protein